MAKLNFNLNGMIPANPFGTKKKAAKVEEKDNTQKFIEMFYCLEKDLRRNFDSPELDDLRKFVAMRSIVANPQAFEGIKSIDELVGQIDGDAVMKAFGALNESEKAALFASAINGTAIKDFVTAYECNLSAEAIKENKAAKEKVSPNYYAKKLRSLYVRQQKLLGAMLCDSERYVDQNVSLEEKGKQFREKVDICIARMLAAKLIAVEVINKGAILGAEQMKLMGSKAYIEDAALNILESAAFKELPEIHDPEMIPPMFTILAIGAENIFDPNGVPTTKASEKSEEAVEILLARYMDDRMKAKEAKEE